MNTPTLSRLGELAEHPRTIEALDRFVNTVASHRHTVDDGKLAEVIGEVQSRLDDVLRLYLDDDVDDADEFPHSIEEDV